MPRKKPWTLMVYLAGDNNLTEEMAWGLQELKRATKGLGRNRQRINVVAHFDPRGSRSRRYDFLPPSPINKPLPPAQQDGNLDRFESVNYSTPEASGALGSSDGVPDGAGDTRRLLRLETFVRNEIERLHDAEEFFLVLSGHGSGAVGDFLIDLDPTTSLSIPELARILELGREAYRQKHKVDKKIAVLGMDSCLMSNAEVCFEIREQVKFLVASEGWVSNTGWPYHRVLEAMIAPNSNKPLQDPRAVAIRVATSYSDFYRDYEVAGVSTDVAVCRLDAFGKNSDIVRELRAFSRECIPRLEAEYARDVLAKSDVRPERARGLLNKLSNNIAKAILPRGGDRRDDLVQKLLNGPDDARRAFSKGGQPNVEALTASQLEALRALLESLDGQYHLDKKTIGERLNDHDKRLGAELKKPSSVGIALAGARVLREFDPGVQEALRLIEGQDADNNPQVKRARSELQKLHNVRWLLDLQNLVSKRPKPSKKAKKKAGSHETPVRDAFVAARWEAQSFKGGVYVDLFDLSRCLESRLTADDPVRPVCRNLQSVVGGSRRRKRTAVVLSHHTGPDSQHAHGLSVYFPVQATDYSPAYENLELAEQTGWGRLVRAYLCATRRGRRDESRHWVETEDQLQRYGEQEIDPLEMEGIEARIAGVTGPPSNDSRFSAYRVRSGTEKGVRGGVPGKVRGGVPGKIRGGVPGKIRGGVPGKIRGGVPGKIRGGVPGKLRGEGALAVWGNPPDGFFRQ